MIKNNLIVIGLIILGIGLYGFGYNQAAKKANDEKTTAVAAAHQVGHDEGVNSALHFTGDVNNGKNDYQNKADGADNITNILEGKVIYLHPDQTTHFSIEADMSNNGNSTVGETRYDCVTNHIPDSTDSKSLATTQEANQVPGTDFSLDCKKVGGVVIPSPTSEIRYIPQPAAQRTTVCQTINKGQSTEEMVCQ